MGPISGESPYACILGSVSERLERCLFVFLIHAQPKFRSHSHRNCLKIMGYFHQENIFDVTYNKNNSLNDFKIYRLLRNQPHHCSMVLEYS